MARVRAIVHGRVQGVSYRMSTVHEAYARGLSGWVKNERDGTVVLEAQGERAKLEDLVAWLKEGPPGARVTKVAVEWLVEEPDAGRFEIRH